MRKSAFCVLLAIAVIAACHATSQRGDEANGAGSPPGGGSSTSPSGEGPGSSTSLPGGSGDDASEPVIPFVAFDINHVVSTGQSNSVAHGGVPPITLAQPYANLMFDVGVMTMADCEARGCFTYEKPHAFVPLVEGDAFWYPVETMSSALGNEITNLATKKYGFAGHVVLVSLAGRNGLTYWCLRKGSCNYVDPSYVPSFQETLNEVTDAKALAAAAGKSYVVRVATAIHGESDDYGYGAGTPEFPLDGTDGMYDEVKSYADGLIEWQRDLEANIQAITGQTQAIPLLISQFSGWNDFATSAVTQYQYEAHVRSKGKVTIVTPGYALDWGPDCRHYSNDGERRLGEYFAKVYARVVFEGKRWEPVRPKTASIAGNVITAAYYVPVPPLVLDTDGVTDPGNYGFEVVDGAGAPVAITSVSLIGPDTVQIVLASTPAATPHLRYAYTHPPRTCTGRFVGARGNLRDSDASPSQYGYELFNWGIHFDVAIGR
jgi:hypothetical protein